MHATCEKRMNEIWAATMKTYTPEELEQQKKMLAENAEYAQHLSSELGTAQNSTWNALLTFHGILIGAFSVIGVYRNEFKAFIVPMLACSVISCTLLIINFLSMEKHFDQLLKTLIGIVTRTPLQNAVANQQRRSSWRWWRTFIAQALLVLECFLLFLLIMYS